ncbi:hypothetical protein CEP51_006664 [Fusarium floridanum]|uniref:Uncharacterized protein n=1 Tax=Fusarium floridanum TaxID=1325733 RepID=A0A428RRY2_9HYPO|nr:hypothetical protein CEP51_006664 [Fusarium floridanum]
MPRSNCRHAIPALSRQTPENTVLLLNLTSYNDYYCFWWPVDGSSGFNDISQIKNRRLSTKSRFRFRRFCERSLCLLEIISLHASDMWLTSWSDKKFRNRLVPGPVGRLDEYTNERSFVGSPGEIVSFSDDGRSGKREYVAWNEFDLDPNHITIKLLTSRRGRSATIVVVIAFEVNMSSLFGMTFSGTHWFPNEYTAESDVLRGKTVQNFHSIEQLQKHKGKQKEGRKDERFQALAWIDLTAEENSLAVEDFRTEPFVDTPACLPFHTTSLTSMHQVHKGDVIFCRLVGDC